jgi:hypothetical protein
MTPSIAMIIHVMLVVDECMSTEQWWVDKGETEVLGENLALCHTLDQKST